MARIMKWVAAASFSITVLLSLLYRLAPSKVLLALAITFGTTAYHFIIRLLIGTVIHRIFRNKVNYNRKWFRVSNLEMRFYRKIKVKKWKGKMPTYAPDTFDPAMHSWDEIAQAMCQAELVHEIIVPFSFLPMVASVWFGELGIFLVTSLLSAAFDLLFVFMQRFNRTRILKIKAKQLS